MRADHHNELSVRFLWLGLWAKGAVALWLALPIGVLILALAWKLVSG
jgi:hypothetical protein